MSILSDIGDGFVDLGNAVSGVGSSIANTVAQTILSAAEGVWSYAIIAGNGIASAGTLVGNGIVSFGTDVGKFSVNASGTLVRWAETSAYDVEAWTKNAVGVVGQFAIEAYQQTRTVALAAWEFLKQLISNTLPDLDDPSSIAHDIAYFVFSAAAMGYEEMAHRAGMTVSLHMTVTAGAILNISSPALGLYVDPDRNWGFLKIIDWEKFKNLSTVSISQATGVSLTVSLIHVFGGRRRYSGTKYLDLGAEVPMGAYNVGGALLVESGNLSFLGYRLSGGVGLSLVPSTGGNPPPPTWKFNDQSIDLTTLLGAVGASGSSSDAAMRAVKNPGQESSVRTAASVATLTPFAPRFFGYLRLPAHENRILSHGLTPVDSASATDLCTFRLVAGLADPSLVSIEMIGTDEIPRYVTVESVFGYIVPTRFDGSDAMKQSSTFVMEPGLSDPSGVSFRVMGSSTAYLTVGPRQYFSVPGVMYLTAKGQATDPVSRRQATFQLVSRPLPPNQSASIRAGEILRLGEWRRSSDGRFFLSLLIDNALQTQYQTRIDLQIRAGSCPSDVRSTPKIISVPAISFQQVPRSMLTDPGLALCVPMRGKPYLFSTSNPAIAPFAMEIQGDPGQVFVAVADSSLIGVFQGFPEQPGELITCNRYAAMTWAKERKTVALKGPSGRYVSLSPNSTDGKGVLRWDATGVGGFETLQLVTLYNGKTAFRTMPGFYASSNWSVGNTPGINYSALQTVNEYPDDTSTMTVEPLLNGQVVIRSVYNGRLWREDPSGMIGADGLDGDPKTQFTLVPLERNLAAECGRTFTITAKHSGKRLGIPLGAQTSAAPIQQLGETGGRNQSFTLLSSSPGLYSFAAQHSGQLLSVSGAYTSAGTGLVQFRDTGDASQRFRLLPNEDGTYSIIASHSGMAIDVTGSRTDEGAPIIQWTPSGSANQRFYIQPEQPLVTRLLIAEPGPTSTTVGMRALYQERFGQSAWLDGWFDGNDNNYAGDFLGVGRAQLLCINRSGSGGRVMLADFGGQSGIGRPLYYETFSESDWLSGWTDDNDWMRIGDFRGTGRSQLLMVNRGGTGGRVAVIEFSALGPIWSYCELWGQNALLNGWQDDNDWWLVGDLMRKGRDQLLCVNRTQGGGKVMVVDFSGATPSVPYWENWGQSPWLTGWLDDPVRHFIGDFLGLGYAQWLMIDSRNRNVQVADLSSGQAKVLLAFTGATLGGWFDDGDAQVVGDFLGRGYVQLLCTNRQPANNGKVMIIEIKPTGVIETPYLEMWGQRTCLDGLLEPGDRLFAADFRGVGQKRAQLMVVSPNVKSAPHPQLVPSRGSSIIGTGIELLGRITTVGDVRVPSEAALFGGGNPIEGFQLTLDPPIPGLSVEYMAHVMNGSDIAWIPEGQYCGNRDRGLVLDGIAIRLTGANKTKYSIRYLVGETQAADGAFCGTRNQNTPLRRIRVVLTGPNLALGKPTLQSSNYGTAESSRAVDGNTDGNFGAWSVTHTNLEYQPYWQVDLQTTQWISRVQIFNRTDGSVDRLNNFTVLVSTDGNTWKTFPYIAPVGPQVLVSIGAVARYVRIRLNGSNYLSLAEVQVFGGS